MKKRLIILGILIAAAIAAYQVFRPGTGNEQDVLQLSGNIEVTEADLGFRFSGRISGLYKEEGQAVMTGERLAVLDSSEARSQVSQSVAAVSEARARMDELKAGSRPQELEQAKAQVGNAEAELTKARRDHERYVGLYEKGAVSAEQRDAMKKNLDVAAAQHQRSLEVLSLVREGPRREEIKAAESRVRQAEAALQTAEERLKDTLLTASLPGVVLKKNFETGEIAASGAPVYTIGDLAHPWIKVYVKEDRLGRVKLGQKAEITTDSYEGRKYEGIVTHISSEAEFTPKNVQTREERVKLVFGIKVSVGNADNELKPGMPADVTIFLK